MCQVALTKIVHAPIQTRGARSARHNAKGEAKQLKEWRVRLAK
jgi:hypothetical protein